ncbi:MAG: SCP2 sterol-binding domain-containing protein [Candidatus Moduliflexus flocculans]|nr:SCP2 sterol-binding domain-containing protein [Candidatus Moduliflexus flocculans]
MQWRLRRPTTSPAASRRWQADGETFVGVNTGKVDATNAFMSGKVKVEGDMGAFGKTGKLFRKFVIAKKEMTTKEYLADMFATIVPRFKAKEAEGLDASLCLRSRRTGWRQVDCLHQGQSLHGHDDHRRQADGNAGI